MSDNDSKGPSRPREDGGKARRTYASLEACRGFQLNQGGQRGTGVVVSVHIMDTRSYWRHVGSGKWNAADAQYEKVDE